MGKVMCRAGLNYRRRQWGATRDDGVVPYVPGRCGLHGHTEEGP